MLADGFLEVRLYRVWPGNGIGVRHWSRSHRTNGSI